MLAHFLISLVVLVLVIGMLVYVVARGITAFRHLNFFTQAMSFAGPTSSLSVGGALNAILGTLEQIGLATLLSVPLAGWPLRCS